MDHLISARPPDLIIINNNNKKQQRTVDFAVPVDHRVKLKTIGKEDKYLDHTRELKKLWNMKMTIIPILIWVIGSVTKIITKGAGGLRNKRISEDHPNDCIIEIGQNTEKSPGESRRLAITQTSGIDHQLTLMWKTLKE